MERDDSPELILVNANVLTMDPRHPVAGAVAVRSDRVIWVGADADDGPPKSAGTRLVDCGGGTLMPGFHDAHMHLLAYASSLLAVDCRPSSVSSIGDIGQALRRRASHTREGEWIRAWGYDETALEDGRHPTRRDLDEFAPRHPTLLRHRSGHACVLNSRALEQVGIDMSFSEPSGATVGRELDSGEPSGLLFEMDDYLDGKVPSPSRDETHTSIKLASSILLARGVTSVQDATHINSVARWDFLNGLIDSVGPMPRITLMPGYRHLNEFVERALKFGVYGPHLRLGHVKIMVTASSGRQTPNSSELPRMVSECVEAGFPVAVHAVESQVVRSVAEALLAASVPNGAGTPHRIEHSSECPPDTLRAVARSAAMVVTQPGFIHQSGDRYLAMVEERVLPYLYRLRTFTEHGVDVAFGSDAPVGDPNPMRGIYAAIERRTNSGITMSENERISVSDALEWYTSAPARAAGMEDEVGRIASGMFADMVLFEEDIASAEAESILEMRPVMTLVGGRIVSGS